MTDPVDILLVEDSADDAAFVRHAIDESGLAAHLRVARDGVEALQIIFGTVTGTDSAAALINPKLIVLDLKLPKIDGLELLRRIKSNPHTRHVPVVVLSSSQETRDLVASYEAHANGYLVKPMDFDEFGALIDTLARFWLQLNQTPKR